MLLKSCAHCGALIPYGKTYCKICEPIMQKKRDEYRRSQKRTYNRKYDEKRDKKYVEFYHSKSWKRLKAQYMTDKGYRCERCGAIADQVHHKQHIQTDGGWVRRLDYSNLELLCTRCHNEEHKRFTSKHRGSKA